MNTYKALDLTESLSDGLCLLRKQARKSGVHLLLVSPPMCSCSGMKNIGKVTDGWRWPSTASVPPTISWGEWV
jgi:hypothetical protein